MLNAADKLRQDALQIWQAGVEAVTPARLFRDKVCLEGTRIRLEDVEIDLSSVRKLLVIGAGKASAAMAVAFQHTVLEPLKHRLPRLAIEGWINAPADTFTVDQAAVVEPIRLFAARPAGLNSPTQDAVYGTQQILQMVRACDARDVVICLLSGGGSALLVAPCPGITLADKQTLAREIAAAGGNIQQLNQVRRAVSEVKGGGLARACRAGQMVTVILSDVLGDPLETIASGPTVSAASSDPIGSLRVLAQLGLDQVPSLSRVISFLKQPPSSVAKRGNAAANSASLAHEVACRVQHVILGNNADAVDAAGVKAVELNYRYVMQGGDRMEGDVMEVARRAADAIEQLSNQDQIDCWISGGEPTVTLPVAGAGQGGRNQQLALAVLRELEVRGWPAGAAGWQDIVFISGGTDGEDGPTDAAGAIIDRQTLTRAAHLNLTASEFLARADAYSFFKQVGGLLHTGATGTNVCDLRVALVGQATG